MSSFRNISHVDASDLFQVERIEDIKNIEEFLEDYEVENRELFNQGLKLFVSAIENRLDIIDSLFENYFKDIFYSIERMDTGDCGKEEVEEKINLISPKLKQWISVNNLLLPCSKIEKGNNDELNDKTEKWNPAQEILIEYIKECDLNVLEAEKISDFIRNEILTLRKDINKESLKDELLFTNEAANYLGISKQRLCVFVKEKRINPIISNSNAMVFLLQDLKDFIIKNRLKKFY